MKTVLYVTLSANGLVTQADGTHPIPPEILRDFAQHVQRAGNVVVGRRTFELMAAQGASGAMAGIATVVVTGSGLKVDGIEVAASPQEALELLERRGCETALVGGGAALDASFLALGLVDEICLNIEPVLMSKGLALESGADRAISLRLVGTATLGENVVQLRYDIDR
ncbi:MAG: dihydrofolate reductase family protein [Gaiellaceae bacterium]